MTGAGGGGVSSCALALSAARPMRSVRAPPEAAKAISTNVAASPLAAPRILQWLRAHGDVLGRVRHAGVPHELLEPPGIHPAVGLYSAGSMPQAVRMDRKVNIRIASSSCDHFINGKSAELLAAFAGEDVAALGFLLALQPFQALGFVRLQVMNAVDAPLETPDLHGALAPVNVVPAQIDQLADPQAVQERYQRHHVVTVTVAVALEGGEQPVQFVLGQMLAGPVILVSLTPFDFPHYVPIDRLPGDDVHWLFSPVSLATFHIKAQKVASSMIRESSNPASLDAALDCFRGSCRQVDLSEFGSGQVFKLCGQEKSAR
jgi:hypothetical protein